MKSYKITTETFTIPLNDYYIFYAPLVGLACEVNSSFVEFIKSLDGKSENFSEHELQILNFLTAKKVVNSDLIFEPINKKILPSKITLFPTNRCQMACGYCYANKQNKILIMDWSIATSAISYYVTNLQKSKCDKYVLELHGGGEPLYEWDFVKNIIQYSQKICNEHNYHFYATAGTNGILNENQLQFIVKNFSSLLVSFEGLPDIQNLQRPMKDGAPSFPYLDHSLTFFDKYKFPYSIRCTVTTLNEHRLDETLAFISKRYRVKTILLEPMYACERFNSNAQIQPPDLLQFSDRFIQLRQQYKQYGINIEYSGAMLSNPGEYFCYIGTPNFAVTPDGAITGCWEVTHRNHPHANTFIFGEVLEDGNISIDKQKYDYLRTLSVKNIEGCKNCFAKWHCAGDCVLKVGHSNYHGPRNSVKCHTNRMLIKQQLKELIE